MHYRKHLHLAVVAHTFFPIPALKEAEAGRFLLVHGWPGKQSEFQDSQSYTEKPWLKKKKKPKKGKKKTPYPSASF